MRPPDLTVASLSSVHEAILAGLQAQFGDRIARYGAYQLEDDFGDPEREIVVPALLLDLESFTTDLAEPDPWGRLPLRCTWTIRCLLSVQADDVQLLLRQLAAAVVSAIVPLAHEDAMRRGQDWGLGSAVGLPEAPDALREDLGLNGVGCWLVRWVQTVYVAEELPL